CRQFLRRGYLHRDRIDRAHPVDARNLRLQSRAAGLGDMGHPNRRRRFPDPFAAPASARPAPQEAAQMISIQWPYSLVGLMFAAFAILGALDRSNRKRFGNAAFWGLMALSLLAGSWLGDFANGLLVLALAALAGFGLIGRGTP